MMEGLLGEDGEPRLPPRVSKFPAPFDFPEKPVPQVPDVSLIFDNNPPIRQGGTPSNVFQNSPRGAGQNTPNRGEEVNVNVKSPSPKIPEEEKPADVVGLLEMVAANASAIGRVEEKLDKILAFQEAFLQNLFKKGALVSKEVQTEGTSPSNSRSSTPAATTTERKKLPKESSISAILPEGRSVLFQPEPSALYSEPSANLKSLQLQEFNDDSFCSLDESGDNSPVLGASASAYGRNNRSHSSDDGERPVKPPTATFYNNVLGNVNRLLEGKEGKKTMNKTSPRRSKENRTPSSTSSSSASASNTGQVVLNTKKYLETLGVQFNSPPPPARLQPNKPNNNNYMIQQNVYNSIYIPTVNCAPDRDQGGSTFLQNLAHKYEVDSKEFQDLKSKGGGGNAGSETTVYGMSDSNLSFATKEYLQRYGLVTKK